MTFYSFVSLNFFYYMFVSFSCLLILKYILVNPARGRCRKKSLLRTYSQTSIKKITDHADFVVIFYT